MFVLLVAGAGLPSARADEWVPYQGPMLSGFAAYLPPQPVWYGVIGWNAGYAPISFDQTVSGSRSAHLALYWSGYVPATGDFDVVPHTSGLWVSGSAKATSALFGSARYSIDVYMYAVSQHCMGEAHWTIASNTSYLGIPRSSSFSRQVALPNLPLLGCVAGDDLSVSLEYHLTSSISNGGGVHGDVKLFGLQAIQDSDAQSIFSLFHRAPPPPPPPVCTRCTTRCCGAVDANGCCDDVCVPSNGACP
jgi:hypothetical protein